MARTRGTEGYAEQTAATVAACESIRSNDLNRPVRHLLPAAPARILDIGAGSGRDAAAFAAMGHRVVAVEPVAELRRWAEELHPSRRITWIDDGLPRLARLNEWPRGFDVIQLQAVWMHLDRRARATAMPRLAGLLRPGGVLLMSLRHGPVPAGKRMFAVRGRETIALARARGLRLVLHLEDQPSVLPGKPEVTWTRLAFRKGPVNQSASAARLG